MLGPTSFEAAVCRINSSGGNDPRPKSEPELDETGKAEVVELVDRTSPGALLGMADDVISRQSEVWVP